MRVVFSLAESDVVIGGAEIEHVPGEKGVQNWSFAVVEGIDVTRVLAAQC